MKTKDDFSTLIQSYFCNNLMNQRHVSDKTIKSYRDTFCLLFKYSYKELGKPAAELSLSDINADLIVKFLDYLEIVRNNSIRSRNLRLAAIHSFFHYASYYKPDALPIIQRVLAIPMKCYDRKSIGYLTRAEINAMIDATNTDTWSNQRDHAMLITLYNTGSRVSEIISACRNDLEFNQTAVIHLHGKGRKDRTIPLWKNTSHILKKWLESIDKDLITPLFPNRYGKAMTRYGVLDRLKNIVRKAEEKCPSLKNKKITPHVIRHTTAMHLLQSGVDINMIALWLGHASITTTHQYMEADLEMKKNILNKLNEVHHSIKRKPLKDKLLNFLERL